MSIAEKSFVTTVWAGIEKVGIMGVQFVITMILARLLDPSSYGIVAMLSVFLAFANLFIDCGFSNALIRKQVCTQEDYSTAFFFNFSVSFITYLTIYAISPIVGDFYEMPILCDVLRVSGLVLFLNSLILVQNAILTKNLAFKEMAKFNILTQTLSGLVAIFLAYWGAGVWALVVQSLLSPFLYFCFLPFVVKWKPKITFSISSFKYLWNFGYKMLLSGILSVAYNNIYSIIIGKCYDAKALGVFNRGQNIALLVPNIISTTFGKSTLPLLSQVQDDKDAFIHVYREFSKLVAFVSFPFIALLFVMAKPFVLFFLTEKWYDAIIYVQIFAVSAFTSAPGMINLNLLQAAGRSDYTLKAETIKKTFGFLVVAVLFSYSPLVLALGSMILNFFIFGVNLYYARKVLGLSYMCQIIDVLPFFIVSIIIGFVIWLATFSIESYLMQMVCGLIICIIIYYLITRYLLKVNYYNKVLDFLCHLK